MKAFISLTALGILGVLMFFSLVTLLAEPSDVQFDLFEFLAIKAVALITIVSSFKGFVVLARTM